MKKSNILLVVLLFGLLFSCDYAMAKKSLDIVPVQNEDVVYQDVVEVSDEFTAEDIFAAVDRWARSANFHRKIGGEQSTTAFVVGGVKTAPEMATMEATHRNRETIVGTEEPNLISLKFYQHYQSKGVTNFVRTLFLDADLRIDIKDGRYRYTISDFEWEHWNHFTAEQYKMSGRDGCGLRGSLYELQSVCTSATGSRKKALIAINDDTNSFISEMRQEILEELTSTEVDDDW